MNGQISDDEINQHINSIIENSNTLSDNNFINYLVKKIDEGKNYSYIFEKILDNTDLIVEIKRSDNDDKKREKINDAILGKKAVPPIAIDILTKTQEKLSKVYFTKDEIKIFRNNMEELYKFMYKFIKNTNQEEQEELYNLVKAYQLFFNSLGNDNPQYKNFGDTVMSMYKKIISNLKKNKFNNNNTAIKLKDVKNIDNPNLKKLDDINNLQDYSDDDDKGRKQLVRRPKNYSDDDDYSDDEIVQKQQVVRRPKNYPNDDEIVLSQKSKTLGLNTNDQFIKIITTAAPEVAIAFVNAQKDIQITQIKNETEQERIRNENTTKQHEIAADVQNKKTNVAHSIVTKDENEMKQKEKSKLMTKIWNTGVSGGAGGLASWATYAATRAASGAASGIDSVSSIIPSVISWWNKTEYKPITYFEHSVDGARIGTTIVVGLLAFLVMFLIMSFFYPVPDDNVNTNGDDSSTKNTKNTKNNQALLAGVSGLMTGGVSAGIGAIISSYRMDFSPIELEDSKVYSLFFDF